MKYFAQSHPIVNSCKTVNLEDLIGTFVHIYLYLTIDATPYITLDISPNTAFYVTIDVA